MTVIHRCAWCPPEPVPEGVVVSHGICENCARTLLGGMEPSQDDVKRLADNQPFTPRPGSYYDNDRFATG